MVLPDIWGAGTGTFIWPHNYSRWDFAVLNWWMGRHRPLNEVVVLEFPPPDDSPEGGEAVYDEE